MFSSKKNKKDSEEKKDDILNLFRFSSMPEEFYGGLDPEIHYVKTEVKPKIVKSPPKEIKKAPEMTKSAPIPTGTPQPLKSPPASPPPNLPQITRPPKKNIVLQILLIIFLLSIIGLSLWWFLFRNMGDGVQDGVPVIPTPLTVSRPTIPIAELEVVEPIEEVEEVVVPQPSITKISLPREDFRRNSDLDADLLSDEEELLLGTDPSVWDSDGDGYYDGQELFNLYNPLGFTPVRLISSGIVAEYLGTPNAYHIYYPIRWQARTVNGTDDHLLVSSPNGEYVEIRKVQREITDSFTDWFAKNVAGENYANLQSFTNHFGMEGYLRRDGLVVYFPREDAVYVLISHATPGTTSNVYRNIISLVYQSFRIGEIGEYSEEQARERLSGLRDDRIIITTPPTSTLELGEDVMSDLSESDLMPVYGGEF